jgi:MFS transporter, FSR family, fosmidomycin resistance protein
MKSHQTSEVVESHQTSEVKPERAGVALLSVSHAVDDLYQGAVPALIPFLVVAYHYDYLKVSGITLAATLISSVAQPAFGYLADRRTSGWLWPAGMVMAAAGIAVAGIASQYLLIWLAVALSGLGVAAYHPESARAVRMTGGGSAQAMSWFALGGNLGFAVGPVAVTAMLGVTGLRGTPLLIVPALAMAAVVFAQRGRLGVLAVPGGRRGAPAAGKRDDWPRFAWLTGVVVCRSVLFFGMSSFLELYLIHRFHESHTVASAALTVFSGAGVIATIGGGWLADRCGRVLTIRCGYALAAPALVGLVLAPDPVAAFAAAAICGLGAYLPFAVQTTLAQEYLPNHLGTASGIALGLAVSAGGLAAPLLGLFADAYSLRDTLAVLVALPLCALALSTRLHETRAQRPGAAARTESAHRNGIHADGARAARSRELP